MMDHKSNSVLSTKRLGGSCLDLSKYDQKRIAVVLRPRGIPKAFSGRAHYENDEFLGDVLRIPIDDPSDRMGVLEILISESEWDGEIRAGSGLDCDYWFKPSDYWPPG